LSLFSFINNSIIYEAFNRKIQCFAALFLMMKFGLCSEFRLQFVFFPPRFAGENTLKREL